MRLKDEDCANIWLTLRSSPILTFTETSKLARQESIPMAPDLAPFMLV